jgi:hypothetical protein
MDRQGDVIAKLTAQLAALESSNVRVCFVFLVGYFTNAIDVQAAFKADLAAAHDLSRMEREKLERAQGAVTDLKMQLALVCWCGFIAAGMQNNT